MLVDEMLVDEMLVDEMLVDEMLVDKMLWAEMGWTWMKLVGGRYIMKSVLMACLHYKNNCFQSM
jgi:hypothetical protein